MKRIIPIIAIISLLVLTAWKLLNNKEAVEGKIYRPDPNLKVGVKTAVAEMRNLAEEAQFLGAFSPNRKIEIRPQAGGEVIQLTIEEGQNVYARQIIAKLDDAQLRYQLEGAQVSLEGYENDLKRYEVLVKGDAVPAINLERTRLSIRSTQAQIKQLKKQIDNTTITAPFAGIITSKMIEKGSVVSVGSPIATLVDISQLKLVVNVPENAVNQFQTGQTISVKTEVHPDAEFKGRITMISAEGDAAHNYPVEILVPNSERNPLKAGMYGTISNADQRKAEALSVPRQAIVGSAKKPQLYVVENGKAVLRPVETGATTNEYYEITKGLKVGEQVIISGQINLRNGVAVIAQ